MPYLSANMLSISQLTHTRKNAKFWIDQFFIKNLNHKLIISNGLVDPIDHLYKFSDQPGLESRLTTLITQANEHSKIWHEQLGHLNFHKLKMMVTQNMVTILPKMLPLDGVCKGFVLGKHHKEPFNFGNAWHASNLLELVHSDICVSFKPN